ncbi:hypothetical protein [Sorangium sp. So ce590]|uniref:hypothetical protein n=1 Tax=unclassified Sorangium TaxID=2621164 RepID=UPI003F629E50
MYEALDRERGEHLALKTPSTLRASPARAAVRAAELDLTWTPARRSAARPSPR